ncbi:unnamed protein product [Dovyalis caffra]|uniref:Ribosomal protein L33 n=1 Tax=Dovyalis caffra TaxID=77055 RepID=A0AAV1RFP1_9ROSI|nr:unnamed protein product [Dovyalis caffra]
MKKKVLRVAVCYKLISGNPKAKKNILGREISFISKASHVNGYVKQMQLARFGRLRA